MKILSRQQLEQDLETSEKIRARKVLKLTYLSNKYQSALNIIRYYTKGKISGEMARCWLDQNNEQYSNPKIDRKSDEA